MRPIDLLSARSAVPSGGRSLRRAGRVAAPIREGEDSATISSIVFDASRTVRLLVGQPHLERRPLARQTPELRPPARHLGPLADRRQAEMAGRGDERLLGL